MILVQHVESQVTTGLKSAVNSKLVKDQAVTKAAKSVKRTYKKKVKPPLSEQKRKDLWQVRFFLRWSLDTDEKNLYSKATKPIQPNSECMTWNPKKLIKKMGEYNYF